MRDLIRPLAGIGLALILLTAPASAHKLKVFAAVAGDAITGYAYFSPGGRAQQASVTAAAPDGTVLFTGRTADDGTFRIPVTQHVAYRITVDGGDAHVATTTVPDSELSDPVAPAAAPGPAAAGPAVLSAEIAEPAGVAPAFDPALLRPLIEQAVAKEVRPLREELDAAQEKIWTHDVLGGLGMILGLFGFAYGFSARRTPDRPPAGRVVGRISAP
jgi:nickel transport protein